MLLHARSGVSTRNSNTPSRYFISKSIHTRYHNMSNSTATRDDNSRSCCGSRSICCSRVITSYTSSNNRESRRIGNSNSPSFTAVRNICKIGAVVGWVLLAGGLLFAPQLYMFYAYGERETKREEGQDDLNQRLSPEATILLAATPDQVLLLNESLILPTANVTAQEVSIRPVSSVDKDMEALLAEKNVVGTKDLRITVVFMDDRHLSVDNTNPMSTKGAVCKEAEELEHFHGTAICLKEGSPLQLVKGWPIRVPEYKEGPWEARVKVERAFVTPSALEKQKKLLLQAVLQIFRAPKEGIFKDQNLSTVPFMGYVKAAVTKQKHLAGALIRHQLLNKVCKLRREKEKSQVELLCEDVEATLADLNEMVEERPTLREVFKKTGIFAGLSVAAFGLAWASHLLGAINKNLEFFDIPTCLWGGSAAGAVSLLYAAIAGPIMAVKRFKWRNKFGWRKRKFLKKVLEEEESLSSSTAAAVDLVLVVNELEHESNELPDPSQLGIDADIQPDPTLIEDPAKTSPLAAKVQPFVSRYIYLDTIHPAIQRFVARGFSRFKERAEEDESELTRLRDFLRKAGKINRQLLSINEYGVFEFTAQQKLRAYVYLGEQLQRELARDLGETDKAFVAVEALYSKEKVDRVLNRMRQLYKDVKNAGGDPLPIDTTKPLVTSLKKRLMQVKESEKFIDAELLRLKDEREEKLPAAEEEETKIVRRDLLLAKAAVKEATDALSLELRVLFENDLQLALEEADNLKETLISLKKAAGKQPSPLQEAEIHDTVEKIAKLNKTVVSIIYQMRELGMEVDVVRSIPVEVEAVNEEE